MGLFNHFPYPDTHQLNLDWILEVVNDCKTKVADLWAYIKDPGTGIQTDLQNALTAADNAAKSAAAAKTSESNADGHAVDAQSYADTAEGAASTARSAATTAGNSATSARTFAAQASASATAAATSAEKAAAIQAAFKALYPIGASYIYYPAVGVTPPDDGVIIDALNTLCEYDDGGSWGRSDLSGDITTEDAAKVSFLVTVRTEDNDTAQVRAPVFVRA